MSDRPRFVIRLRRPANVVETISAVQFLAAAGDGLFLTCSALYAIQFIGLSPVEVGVALSVAAGCGLLMGILIGFLVDRGALGVMLTGALLGGAINLFLFTLTYEFLGVLLCLSLIKCFQRASVTLRSAAIPKLIVGEGRVEARAQMQIAGNLGLAVGIFVGGFAVGIEARQIFVAALVACSVLYLAAAGCSWRWMPKESCATVEVQTTPDDSGSLPVHRDWQFVGFVTLYAVLLFNVPILGLVLPVWVTTFTASPVWIVSVLFLINVFMVVAFQRRVARAVTELGGGSASTLVLASIVISVGFILYAMSALPASSMLSCAALILGAFVQAIGEMILFSAAWDLSYRMSPSDRHGQYQGVFASAMPIAEIFAPLLFTVAILNFGVWGFLLISAMFVIAALVMTYFLRAHPGETLTQTTVSLVSAFRQK